MQHTHHSTPFSEKKHSITLVCDGVSGPANIGGLLRLGDAFGIEQLIFCNASIDFTLPRLRRASRNTHITMSHTVNDDIVSCISELKSDSYHIIGLEITSISKPIQEIECSKDQKIGLVIGNERYGISQEVLELLDETAHIEMFGLNSSMNVTQATAIALFELTKS
ncbi:MAG: TrmH family RNA methyltransferase [Bacteroidota bacterium]